MRNACRAEAVMICRLPWRKAVLVAVVLVAVVGAGPESSTTNARPSIRIILTGFLPPAADAFFSGHPIVMILLCSAIS
jgi:hypothetical protein